MIMESYDQANRKNQQKKAVIPKQLESEDIMNSSFYQDMDVEKQKKIYE